MRQCESRLHEGLKNGEIWSNLTNFASLEVIWITNYVIKPIKWEVLGTFLSLDARGTLLTVRRWCYFWLKVNRSCKKGGCVSKRNMKRRTSKVVIFRVNEVINFETSHVKEDNAPRGKIRLHDESRRKLLKHKGRWRMKKKVPQFTQVLLGYITH